MINRFRATMRGFRREDRAAAMVEFAIVAPLLFLLIFGIIDFGRVFFLYNNLTNAAREGARLGAVSTCNSTSVSSIQAATKARINDKATTVAAATVNVTHPGTTPAKTVKVVISNYPFTPVTFIAIKTAKQLTVTAEFRCEQQ